jgi:hypothetical protein
VPFSRLLLLAISSKKYIAGKDKRDKLWVKPKAALSASSLDTYAGEVVLCFQLDDPDDQERQRHIAYSLGIEDESKRCDGLIFYARDDDDLKVICQAEMKSINLGEADKQLKSTRQAIENLLKNECGTYCADELKRIQWKACFYHNCSSPSEVAKVMKRLKDAEFDDVDNFQSSNSDVGPFLRGETDLRKRAENLRGKKGKRGR